MALAPAKDSSEPAETAAAEVMQPKQSRRQEPTSLTEKTFSGDGGVFWGISRTSKTPCPHTEGKISLQVLLAWVWTQRMGEGFWEKGEFSKDSRACGRERRKSWRPQRCKRFCLQPPISALEFRCPGAQSTCLTEPHRRTPLLDYTVVCMNFLTHPARSLGWM